MTRFTPTHGRVISFFLLLWILFPATGYAYLDPETGSYGFQMLLAVGLVLFFAARAHWKKLKGKLPNTPKANDAGKDGPAGEAAEASPKP